MLTIVHMCGAMVCGDQGPFELQGGVDRAIDIRGHWPLLIVVLDLPGLSKQFDQAWIRYSGFLPYSKWERQTPGRSSRSRTRDAHDINQRWSESLSTSKAARNIVKPILKHKMEESGQLALGDYLRYGRQMILDGFGLPGTA